MERGGLELEIMAVDTNRPIKNPPKQVYCSEGFLLLIMLRYVEQYYFILAVIGFFKPLKSLI